MCVEPNKLHWRRPVPSHLQAAAGHLHLDRGVSLRFPRFIRLRPDKSPEEASGPELLVELYNKQTRRVQSASERLGRGGVQSSE